MNGGTPWLGTVAPTNSDHDREADAEQRPGAGARSAPAARSSGRAGSELQADHDDDRRAPPGRVHSVAGPGSTSAPRNVPERAPRSGERNRIQPKHDEVEGDEPAQPRRGAFDAPAERVLDAQPGAVERAPEHERPGGAVPEPAEHHREHQVAVGAAACPCGCRRAGCRGSRAGSATASCASAARSRGSRSRGTGCGSSAGRRSPSAARARSRCRCSRRSRSRSAPRRRRRRAATSGAW